MSHNGKFVWRVLTKGLILHLVQSGLSSCSSFAFPWHLLSVKSWVQWFWQNPTSRAGFVQCHGICHVGLWVGVRSVVLILSELCIPIVCVQLFEQHFHRADGGCTNSELYALYMCLFSLLWPVRRWNTRVCSSLLSLWKASSWEKLECFSSHLWWIAASQLLIGRTGLREDISFYPYSCTFFSVFL